MSLKIILPLLALVGQIASNVNDADKIFKDQEKLDALPNLPDDGEVRSAFLPSINDWPQTGPIRPPGSLLPGMYPPPPPPPPKCRCQFGNSMCAQNPNDQQELACINYCYKTYYPSLDVNRYRWVCAVYSPYGYGSGVLAASANNQDNPQQGPPQAVPYPPPQGVPYAPPQAVPYPPPQGVPYPPPQGVSYPLPQGVSYLLPQGMPYSPQGPQSLLPVPPQSPFQGLLGPPVPAPYQSKSVVNNDV